MQPGRKFENEETCVRRVIEVARKAVWKDRKHCGAAVLCLKSRQDRSARTEKRVRAGDGSKWVLLPMFERRIRRIGKRNEAIDAVVEVEVSFRGGFRPECSCDPLNALEMITQFFTFTADRVFFVRSVPGIRP